MKRQLALALLFAVALAPPCLGQKEKEKQEPLTPSHEEGGRLRSHLHVRPGHGAESLPPELLGALKPVELPEGEDSWAVQLITRGGFAGTGRGDVTITSDGGVRCSPPAMRCPDLRPGAALTSLSKLVAAARPSNWKRTAAVPCRDCYVTMLVLQRREGGGAVKTYTAYWDDTNAASIPVEVSNIYMAVAELTHGPATAP